MAKTLSNRRKDIKKAFNQERTAALQMLALLTESLEKRTANEMTHWGHVGDLTEINKHLRRTAHWAGIPGYVEQ